MSGADYVREALFGNSNQVPTAAAVAAAPPDSAAPSLAAGDRWGAAGLQPAPCVPWAPTADTGLTPAAEAGGMAAAAVPQAPTGQLAAWSEAEAALVWPNSTPADARTTCSSFEQALPPALGPSMQLLLFQQLLKLGHNPARQQGGQAAYRAPPQLPGGYLLGHTAAGSGSLPGGEASLLAARLGAAAPAAPVTTETAAAPAAAAAAPAAAEALHFGGPYPQGEQACQAFKGGGGSSLLQPQHHASSALWGSDNGGTQQDDAARAPHTEVGAKRKKKARPRDCLSRVMAKATQGLESVCMDIERERAGIEVARKEEQALEQLLDYQAHLTQAMEQQEGGATLQIPAEALKLLREEDVSRAFPLDWILRYPVAGDTGHLGPDGRVCKVPSFSKVLEDWRQIVAALKQLVLDALENGRTAQQELGQQELGQQELGRASSSLLLLPEGVPWEQEGSSRLSYLSQQQRRQQQQQRWLGRSTSRPAPARHTASGEVKLAVTAAVKVAAALGPQSQGTACEEGVADYREGVGESEEPSTGCAPEDNSKADSLRPSSQVEVHVRRMLVLDRLCGHEHATTADGRLVVQHSEGPHSFSEDQLKDLAQLLFCAGLLLWQQVLLCPDNFGRLVARRLDVGPEEDETEEAQCPGHWEDVVASLELEPKQALEIVQLYREYEDKLALIKRDRAAAAKAVQQIQAQLESLSLGLVPRTQANLELQRAAGALAKCSLKDYLPLVTLVNNVYRVLNFPVQRAKLFTSSWPYFPQIDQIAILSARQFNLATTPSESAAL